MKAKELKHLIQESVKEVLKEDVGYHDGSASFVDEELEKKVQQAVILAVHCAKTLLGIAPKPSTYDGSVVGKCLDDIQELFVDSSGEFMLPEVNPDEVRHEFLNQLNMQMAKPEGKLWQISQTILDKAADKLDVYIAETLNAESWGPEGDGDEHFFSTTLPSMGEDVLIWAEKGKEFLKQQIEKTAKTHGVEPSSFVDDLEHYVIKAWKKRTPTNEYIPGERLSGHHGQLLDTVQSALDELGSNSSTFYTTESFHNLVRELIQEAVRDHMVNELERLHLKELGGVTGTQGTDFSEPTSGTSGTSETSGTKSGIQTQPGNKDVANNVMVPGSNMNINQGLQAAAKDPNFKKKAELVQKISNQIAGMKGVVVKGNG